MNLRTIAVAAALTACSPLTVFAQALMGGAMSTPPLPSYQPGCGYSCGPAYQAHYHRPHSQKSTSTRKKPYAKPH
jgi:hypothetical protein